MLKVVRCHALPMMFYPSHSMTGHNNRRFRRRLKDPHQSHALLSELPLNASLPCVSAPCLNEATDAAVHSDTDPSTLIVFAVIVPGLRPFYGLLTDLFTQLLDKNKAYL